MASRAAVVTRLALILFLMGAVICSQAATSDQFHQHSTQHCCGLCHAGMPFVHPVVVSAFAPLLPYSWVESSSGAQAPHEVLLTAASSRAPPA